MYKAYLTALAIQSLYIVVFTLTRLGLSAVEIFVPFGLFLSPFIGLFLLWQALRHPKVNGWQKWYGVLLGILPFVGILFMVYFWANFEMH
jgi:hypothetical protein